MSKTAIVILSDPNAGEEALGRVINGLAAAYDYKQAGDDVKIIFQSTGTRWPDQLRKEDHPVNALYKAVEDKIEGLCKACADLFGAETSGFDLLDNNPVPNTSGLSSYRELQAEGYNVLNF